MRYAKKQRESENFPTFEYEKLAALSGHLIWWHRRGGTRTACGLVVAAAVAWYRSSSGGSGHGRAIRINSFVIPKRSRGTSEERRIGGFVEHFEIGAGSVDAR